MSNVEIQEDLNESPKEDTVEVIFDTVPTFDGKYFYAVGRRKSAIAQIRLFPCDSKQSSGIIVNNRPMRDFFSTARLQAVVLKPIVTLGGDVNYAVSVLVRGGGITGQAEAISLGIARALTVYKDDFRAILKASGLLKRDSRVVERKKPGLKKARRAPQWQKR